MARITNGLRWKINGKLALKVPGHSGQRWGLDYLLGSSAVVLREYFYLKKKRFKISNSFRKIEDSLFLNRLMLRMAEMI